MEGEPGQILSFRKAAAGDFPTRKACWKHLAHEEYLAEEQVVGFPPPFFLFGPRYQERTSQTTLSFSSNAVLGTQRETEKSDIIRSASVLPPPAVSTGYIPMATIFVCC